FNQFGQNYHVTILVCIDPMTPENGTLEMATNHKELWKEKINIPHTDKGSIVDEWLQKLEWKSISLRPGDVLVFGSYIPHRSGPNLTDTSRRVIYLTFNRESEGDKRDIYYKDKREKFPPLSMRDPNK